MILATIDQYRTVRKRLSSIKPSPENLELYRAAADDPDILKLAESIKTNGLQEPLIITEDNYIVSGHRRYAALVHNGQKQAPCRVMPVKRSEMGEDEFITLLREHNRQRNKTVVEQIREELVDINPEDAYDELTMRREEAEDGAYQHSVETIKIEGRKHRCEISDQKADHVKYVLQVVNSDRKAYWPLSVRGIHYALLNYEFLRNIPRKLRYLNDSESYQATSDLTTRMRLNGMIPWECLDEAIRSIIDVDAYNAEIEREEQEAEYLQEARGIAVTALKGLLKEGVQPDED